MHYYSNPTQVVFTTMEDEPNGRERLSGIAFKDFVICGCCGGLFDLDRVKIEEELSWVNLLEEICPEYEYGPIEDEDQFGE